MFPGNSQILPMRCQECQENLHSSWNPSRDDSWMSNKKTPQPSIGIIDDHHSSTSWWSKMTLSVLLRSVSPMITPPSFLTLRSPCYLNILQSPCSCHGPITILRAQPHSYHMYIYIYLCEIFHMKHLTLPKKPSMEVS